MCVQPTSIAYGTYGFMNFLHQFCAHPWEEVKGNKQEKTTDLFLHLPLSLRVSDSLFCAFSMHLSWPWMLAYLWICMSPLTVCKL